jgi:SET domain-containing protein
MLKVKKSRIQGTGLYTDCAIGARKKIGELTGELISVREANKRAKQAKRIAIVQLSDKEAIDGGVNGGPFQFVNHSCEPNVFIRIAYGRVEFYTMRKIKVGEELTCDYGYSYHEGQLPCRCGSPKCRKFI